VIRFFTVRYPLSLALAAWMRLLIPSRMPLLIFDVNHLRMPSQWRFMDIVVQNPPEPGVVLFDNIRNGFYRHRLGHHHNQRLKQQRKTTSRTSPGNLDRFDATISTTHTRNPSIQICLMLEKVQMPPCVPLSVVCTAPLSAANGTAKNTATGKINLNIQTTLIHVKLTRHHIPWRPQTQCQLKKFCVPHNDPYQPPQYLDYGSLSCSKRGYPYFLARSRFFHLQIPF